MGILRTDKVSGLETPTPVTGSVVFDGNNDDLQIADSNDFTFAKNDFTIEFWRYKQALAVDTYVSIYGSEAATRTFWFGQGGDGAEQFYWYHDSSTRSISSSPYPINTWSHLAAVRYNGTMTLYVDGVEAASTTSNVDVTINDTTENLVIGSDAGSAYDYQGYISNLRILNGTALYTSEFTPPVHELEVIGDTVLLCCNNPDSAGAEGTGKSITVNNNAAASTFSPGLTRDFTYGTEFRGVTSFDTQGYFVPPSGTTEQRGRGRGLFAGGVSPNNSNTIYFINISSSGIAGDFGDLTVKRSELGGCASSTRGVFAGGTSTGESPAPPFNRSNVIDYVTLASAGNAGDFGDLTDNHDLIYCGLSNNTRGIIMGGGYPGPIFFSDMEYITISTNGNGTDFGDLTLARHSGTATATQTRGIYAGGSNPTYYNIIDYVTLTSLGNAQDFGDLTVWGERRSSQSVSDSHGGLGGF